MFVDGGLEASAARIVTGFWADALIDAAVAGEIAQIPASPEDFVRSYKDAQLQEGT